jgi:hypothetical protein
MFPSQFVKAPLDPAGKLEIVAVDGQDPPLFGAYAKTLPKTVCSFIDPDTGKPAEMEQTYETIFGEIVNSWLVAKDLKRALSKRVLYLKDGDVYQTKAMASDALKRYLSEPKLGTLYQDKTILNLLPFDQALTIYRGATA